MLQQTAIHVLVNSNTSSKAVTHMQTSARLTSKAQLNANTQQAVTQYLLHNTVTKLAAKHSKRKQQRSLHIGKNCSTRAGARV